MPVTTHAHERAGIRTTRRFEVDVDASATLGASLTDDGVVQTTLEQDVNVRDVRVTTTRRQYGAPGSFLQAIPADVAVNADEGPAAVAALVARCAEWTKARVTAAYFAPYVAVVGNDQPRVPILTPSGWAPKRGVFQVYGVPLDVDAYLEVYAQAVAFNPPDTDLSVIVVEPDYVSADGQLHGRTTGMWRVKPTTADEEATTGCRLKFDDRGCYRIVGTAEGLGYTQARPATGDAQPGWDASWGWYGYGQAPPDDRLDQLDTFELKASLMSMSASALDLAGLLVSRDDVEAGAIEHPVSFGIGADLVRKGYRYPAQLGDGGMDAAPLQEGMRFQLDPALDVDALGLSPLARMIAHAVQRYGLILVDKSNNGGVVGIPGQRGIVDLFPTIPLGAKDELLCFHEAAANPNGTRPTEAQAEFPWNRLRLIATGTPSDPVPTT